MKELFISGKQSIIIIIIIIIIIFNSESQPIHSIPQAHFDDKDGKPKAVNDLIYHPDGHLLCSGGNDSMIKMWIRPRPGDKREMDYQLIARNGYIEKSIYIFYLFYFYSYKTRSSFCSNSLFISRTSPKYIYLYYILFNY